MNKVEVTSTERQVRDHDMTLCPICGKSICIMTPKSYSYKAVNRAGFVRYMCSWKCFNEACTKISGSKSGVKK